MIRFLTALLAVAATFCVNAEVWQGRYGIAETFDFKLYNADGTLDVDEVDAGTEVSLSCDEGAEGTATNDFADEGNFYSIALTAAEMKCERIAVVVAATTTEVFFIQTNAGQAVVHEGTLQSATGTTAVIAAAASFADDLILGATLEITGGTGAGQARIITDWVSATDTATVSTWTTTPDNTSIYQIIGTPGGSPSIAAVYDRLGAPAGASVSVDIAAIEAQTDDIGAAGVGLTAVSIAAGGIAAGDFAAGAITAASTAADFSTEVQDADVESVNGVTITGDGSVSPFGVSYRRQLRKEFRDEMRQIKREMKEQPNEQPRVIEVSL